MEELHFNQWFGWNTIFIHMFTCFLHYFQEMQENCQNVKKTNRQQLQHSESYGYCCCKSFAKSITHVWWFMLYYSIWKLVHLSALSHNAFNFVGACSSENKNVYAFFFYQHASRIPLVKKPLQASHVNTNVQIMTCLSGLPVDGKYLHESTSSSQEFCLSEICWNNLSEILHLLIPKLGTGWEPVGHSPLQLSVVTSLSSQAFVHSQKIPSNGFCKYIKKKKKSIVLFFDAIDCYMLLYLVFVHGNSLYIKVK